MSTPQTIAQALAATTNPGQPIIDKGRSIAQLQRRPPAAADTVTTLETAGYNAVAARVLASRVPTNPKAIVAPGLRTLNAPTDLPDMTPAIKRLSRAVIDRQTIGIVTDHDVDGVTSHAIIIDTLTRWCGIPHENIRSFIGHRLKHGYGVSDPVVDQILADSKCPAVVITADCGSADEPRIKRLADAGIDVIVTDHHELGYEQNDAGEWVETPPSSALAVINPARADSQYPDKTICGAMVSWLTMSLLRSYLVKIHYLPDNTPSLAALLDFVALGTIADCVSLATHNNRAVVQAGLKRIEAQARPCWQAAQTFLGNSTSLGARDIAFGIAPRLNARGRLDEAKAGVWFLLSSTVEEAEQRARELDDVNSERKEIERALTDVAIKAADRQIEGGQKGLAIWLPNGHPGVHGIVASRILDRHGKPVICFSPHAVHEDVVTGSARSPAGVHIRDIIEGISRQHPNLIDKFGGHAAAGGITMKKENLTKFMQAFGEATRQLDTANLTPSVTTEGAIEGIEINDEMLAGLHELEPFGTGFEVPIFEANFHVIQARQVGADRVHTQLVLDDGVKTHKGIWFYSCAPSEKPPIETGHQARLAFEAGYNEYNGNRSIQLIIRGRVYAAK